MFQAAAIANRDKRAVDVRVCRDDHSIWLDLGDDDWTLIRITTDGWKVMPSPIAPLIRPNGMRALPMPKRDPDALGKLRRLLNLTEGTAGDNDFRLIVGWLVAALMPSGPYALLALDGEQGSGKSTAAKMLRNLVDPNLAAHRAPPRNEDDLLIAATNGRVVAIDNVSVVQPEMADALCRLATGAGFSKRRLYTDAEEHIVSIARPVLLNGIPSLLARGDLADRALAVTLPAIPDDRRKTEAQVWADFEAATPGILALLLDAVACVLRDMNRLELPRLPRMADFARLACAAAPVFGWKAEDMLDAIESNRRTAVAAVVEADAVGTALVALMHGRSAAWQGTATELLAALAAHVPEAAQKERGWPKDGTRLSARLRRVVPALRRSGLTVDMPNGGGRDGRRITVWTSAEKDSERSQRSVGPLSDKPLETGEIFGTLPASPSVPAQPVALRRKMPERWRPSRNAAELASVTPNTLKSFGNNADSAGNADPGLLATPADQGGPDTPPWTGTI